METEFKVTIAATGFWQTENAAEQHTIRCRKSLQGTHKGKFEGKVKVDKSIQK